MNKMKGFDAFERSLKNSLESYEVPYNSSDWARLEERMDRQGGGQWQASAGLYVLLLSGALAVGTTLQLFFSDPDTGLGTPVAEAMLAQEVADHEIGPIAKGDVADQAPVATNEEVTAVAAPVVNGRNATVDPRPKAAKATGAGAMRTEDRTSGRSDGTGNTPDQAEDDHGMPIGHGTNTNELHIMPSITEGCPGTSVEFTVKNLPDDGIHLWNFGDGSFSNQPNPKHTFSKAGTYEVMLSHSSMSGGNIHNKPVSDRIIIHEAPEASFNILKREFENTIPSVHFENRSLGGKQFHWDFGDGRTSNIPHPDHVYKRKGTYTVTLTVSNAMGCVDRVERTVRIDSDYDLLAPKAFSPNGDGVEDTFIPEALRTLGVKFHLSIFDGSNGQLIYETTDPGRPWNGRIGNKGDLVATGDHVWMVEMKDGDKLGGTYNGTVSLLR